MNIELCGHGRKVHYTSPVGGSSCIKLNRKPAIYTCFPANAGGIFHYENAIKAAMQASQGKNDKFFHASLIRHLQTNGLTVSVEEKARKMPKPKPKADTFPQGKYLAGAATVNLYPADNTVVVRFHTITGHVNASLRYRKSWSIKKYIDTVVDNSDITLDPNFGYDWEKFLAGEKSSMHWIKMSEQQPNANQKCYIHNLHGKVVTATWQFYGDNAVWSFPNGGFLYPSDVSKWADAT